MSLETMIADADSASGAPISVSFEFSPPKTDEAETALWSTIKRLEPLQPSFVSVTYGAGGSTRERTHATVKRILAETLLVPAAHLTCVNHTREEVRVLLEKIRALNCKNILALRGDAPGDGDFAALDVIAARLGAGFRGREFILERVNALGAQGGELGLALFDE